MAAGLLLGSCQREKIDPISGDFLPAPSEVVFSKLDKSEAAKDENGRWIFVLDFSDDASNTLHAVIVGNKYYLGANSYTEAPDATAKNGNFISGKTTVNGKPVESGKITVFEKAPQYTVSAVLFTTDGAPYKIEWSGELIYEEPVVLEPEYTYTDTVAQDCTDSNNTPFLDVESHTLVLKDLSGEFAAQIKLVRTVGTTDLTGVYTVAEYAHEDLTAGNGFDLGVYFGMAEGAYVIGSYYVADGVVTIIEPGATISVTGMGDGIYSIEGEGYSFLTAPEGFVPGGGTVYDATDTVAQDCTLEDGQTLVEDVESHTIVLKDEEDAVVAQIKLVRSVGTTDLSGEYTVKEYAHEDLSAGNGFDLGVYFGMPEGSYVIGSYYFDEEGALVIVQPGETITVSSVAENTYKFVGSTDWEFIAKVAANDPGPVDPQPGDDDPDEAVLTDFLSFTSYAQYGVSLAGAELATAGFSYTAEMDWTTWTTNYTFSGDGAFIKLELYTEGDSFAAGTYTPSADPSNVAAGEFKTGSAAGGTTWNVVKDNQITSKYITDGTVTVSKEGDVYTIVIESSVLKATYTGKLSAEVAGGIVIDGNFDDWAEIEGVGDGNHGMFKVASDATNIYVYSWRKTSGRYNEIWGGSGYVYFALDLDNDATTGVDLWGNGPYEFVGVIYPYAGSADSPAFKEAPGDACMPEGCTLENVKCKGAVDENGAYIEFSIPRADLPAIPTTAIKAISWGNKDLTKVTLSCTL